MRIKSRLRSKSIARGRVNKLTGVELELVHIEREVGLGVISLFGKPVN